MRMVVAGGGTGGHLFPGLAVAEAASSAPSAAVLFVGSSSGIEARVIPRTRFPFHALTIHGVRGRGARGPLELLWQMPAALARAWSILGEFRSELVLGVGGYASVPVVVAAWLRGVPSVLLEQNARPGWANRVLGRVARKVCTTFPDAGAYFPADKVVCTGTPVRPFAERERQASGGGFNVLIFGGSQGAHHINEAAHAAAAELRAAIPGLRVVHQTGESDRAALAARYAELGIDADVRAFIDDMGEVYARADVVVCRAGATTLAELTALGKAAVLVPYPFAADDHQRANAEVLARRDAAILILDRELDGPRLAATLVGLARDRERQVRMGEAARQLAVPDAAARVVEVCRRVVEEGGSHG
jgi:UDP-N-acetylglucosamine--N-acetylmuramyl-(pentapeptide) pyrophosphoryl-undecaprenol N-acetylglucosamine transferase